MKKSNGYLIKQLEDEWILLPVGEKTETEIQMIFIDHNHRYLGKEYVVVRSCVFAFVIRRFNIYCVEVKPL